VVSLLVLLGACSSSAGETSANYAPIDSGESGESAGANGATESSGSSGSGTATADGGSDAPASDPDSALSSAPVSVEGFDAATTTYDSFLELRAQAIVRQVELDALDAVATPTAIDQVAQLRAENDQRIADGSYAVRADLVEFANVTSIDQAGDRLAFTDCTEQHYRTPAGETVVRFVTNDVAMVEAGGRFLVDEVTTVQDGIVTLSPGEFGCAPPSFAERGRSTAQTAVEAVAALVAEPSRSLEEPLPAVIVGEAGEDLALALQTLATQGLSRVADETVTYDVLGIDVNRPEFTVVVAVCRTYPTGRSYLDSTGASTQPDLPIGSSYQEWLYVQLEPVPSGTQTADAVTEIEDRGPNCERG